MLEQQINEDIKAAMKARNESALRALRAIKAAFLLANSEKGADESLSDDKALSVISKLVKQRKDSIEIYEANGREDLARVEKEELDVFQQYLPQPLGETEILEILTGIIQETGANSAADTGKVMPLAMKRMAGKADGKQITQLLKTLF